MGAKQSKSKSRTKYNKTAFGMHKSAQDNAQRFCYENRNFLENFKPGMNQKNFKNAKYIYRLREILEGRHKQSTFQQEVIDIVAKDDLYFDILTQLDKFNYEIQKELVIILQIMFLEDQSGSIKNFFLSHLELLDICIQSQSDESKAKILAPLIQEICKNPTLHQNLCDIKFVEILCGSNYSKSSVFIVQSETLQTLISILSQFEFQHLQNFLSSNKETIILYLHELIDKENYFVTRKVLEFLTQLIEKSQDIEGYYTSSEDNFIRVMKHLRDNSTQVKYVSFKLFYQFLTNLQTRDVEVIRKIVIKNKANLEKLINSFQFDEEQEEHKLLIEVKQQVFNIMKKLEEDQIQRDLKKSQNVQ